MVFQDPSAALNPSMTIEEAVGHPLVIHKIASGAELKRRVHETLERVGLAPVERFADKYPSDLSGGQKQRAVIARAIILGPEVLVADEPISMLDMSVRAKILQLMLDLKNDLGLTYLYITHDLASAKYFCDRIAIMYLGRIVEIGPTEEIFANPRHPYTKALLKAIPEPDPTRMVPRDLPRGEIPDAAEPPLGCSFHPRCPEAVAACGWESRDLRVVLEQHWTRRTRRLRRRAGPDRRPRPLRQARDVGDAHGRRPPRARSTLLERIRAREPRRADVERRTVAGVRRPPASTSSSTTASTPRCARRRRRGGVRALPRGARAAPGALGTGARAARAWPRGSGGGVPPHAGHSAWWAHQPHSALRWGW